VGGSVLLNTYKAILFDLDETLLDRDRAVDHLFFIILEKYYKDLSDASKVHMLKVFKNYDKNSYGISDKSKVFSSFFHDFPPNIAMPATDTQEFWNHYFPRCFSIDEETLTLLQLIKKKVKIGIITNGTVRRQKAKIINTGLDAIFKQIIISEEVDCWKPDSHIFHLALNTLKVEAEETLFVGDDLTKDILGCQNVKMKGIWFNPHKKINDTHIKPFGEIQTLGSLLRYLD